MNLFKFLLIICICYYSIPLTNSINSYHKEQIKDFIHEYMERNKIIGLALEIVEDGKTSWTEGFGHQYLENNISVTNQTLFRWASYQR